MNSLSIRFACCNIASVVERQIREIFDGDKRFVSDGAAILLHGSILSPEKWSSDGRPSDIDLLMVEPELSRERLASICRGLRALDLPGGPIELDLRVGPLDVTDGVSGEAVVVQAAICSSYDDISPATLQILAYGGRAVIGALPDAERLRQYGVEALEAWLERDLADVVAIVIDDAIPYWTLSKDSVPRRIRGLQAPRTSIERGKAQRHAEGKLRSWSLLALSCRAGQLCGMAPAEIAMLAGAVHDRHAFEAALARLRARFSGG